MAAFEDDGVSEDELLQDNDNEEMALREVEPDDTAKLHDNFDVLTEADIHRRIQDDIADVTAVLSISKVEASILLLNYGWSVSKVHDAWFLDENKERQKAGLHVKPSMELSVDLDEVLCGICFESYPFDRIKSTKCGHPYCNECWSSYIKIAIADGPGSLLLKCPEPSCGAAVGEDLVRVFASEEEKKKYSGYLVMSYIEGNKLIKYCPGPGCENAIKIVAGSVNFDVCCPCSHIFCWNCTQEAHRPVDCETVRKWMLKNSAEGESVNCILAFTKPCPKCRRPIEKNMGCSKMRCRAPCNYAFCWLCLRGLENHGACNGYAGKSVEEANAKARKYIRRYIHYYERWATNLKSMKKAAADLKIVRDQQIETLCSVQEQPAANEFSFLTEAWQQIVECRKVLTWTYAYGYYLSDEEPAKRNLFEHLQGQAESALERLHFCAEMELSPFLKDQCPKGEFVEFRRKLASLTRVTRNFFENLVTGLEDGLSEVNSRDGSRASKRARRDSDSDRPYIAEGPWFCSYCTFENNSSAKSCRVCGRGSWTCDRCTYSNLRTSATCEICQALQPT